MNFFWVIVQALLFKCKSFVADSLIGKTAVLQAAIMGSSPIRSIFGYIFEGLFINCGIIFWFCKGIRV